MPSVCRRLSGQVAHPSVRSAVALPRSSGVAEGRATDLKMIKRQMVGRASIPLLRRRVILVAHSRRTGTTSPAIEDVPGSTAQGQSRQSAGPYSRGDVPHHTLDLFHALLHLLGTGAERVLDVVITGIGARGTTPGGRALDESCEPCGRIHHA